jgi:D-xylose 1-dehydrogenase (NADP+, D-xylono-1,5-lactone-forming)
VSDRPLRWGIMSTSRIGRRAVVPAIAASSGSELLAVASRSHEAAAAFAAEASIPRSYGSYDDLLADPDVEAVYIPLPNSLHAPWTVRAVEAGKHVLCEKPLGLSAAECRVMQGAAELHGVRLMEAFMYRYHPRTRRVVELVRSGALGALRTIRSTFSFVVEDPANIRLDAHLGGGSLMDVGCYCVDVGRALAGAEPDEVQAFMTLHPGGVDRSLAGTLRFGDELVAQFTCSLDAARTEAVEVVGREGRIDVPRAFLPGQGATEATWTGHDGEVRPMAFEGVDQYRLMVEHFEEVVRDGVAPLTGAEEAARTMRVVEGLYASARDGGRPVALG